MKKPLELYQSAEALTLLLDLEFIGSWNLLHQECPWATPFQTSGFINEWFNTYGGIFSPVVLVQRENEGDVLNAILILAQKPNDHTLYVAGTHQAEYQAWLERPGEYIFLKHAIDMLDDAFPNHNLTFKYLPKEVPLTQITQSKNLYRRIKSEKVQRPLLVLTEEAVADSFRKKSNKSRFNRLNRKGTVKFERIQDIKEFTRAFEQIIPYYDFRQGAVNNSYPFLEDDLKKPFHINLLQNNPELLHVTALCLDDVPIAFHLGFVDKRMVHLAIITHSPLYSNLSPGKLHIMLLNKLFLEEGLNTLDLTPGGDPWKERFANTHDHVYLLTIYRHRLAKTYDALTKEVLVFIKNLLKLISISPGDLKRVIKKLTRLRIGSIVTKISNFLYKYGEYRIYELTVKDSTSEDNPKINVDCITDLLLFEPMESWQNKQNFLYQALSRLEQGEHVYTYVDNGKLLHFGWLIENQKKAYFPEVAQEFQYEKPGAVLYDFYTSPEARGKSLYQKTISKMLFDASNLANVDTVYISCLAHNLPSRHVIEKFGFDHRTSLFTRKVLGQSKKWSSDMLEAKT